MKVSFFQLFFIFFSFTLFSIPLVMAESFPGPGYDYSFVSERSYFNADLSTDLRINRGASDGAGSLYAYDIDGLSGKEIFGIDGDMIVAYSGDGLIFQDSYQLGLNAVADGDYYSNIEFFDIDGDSVVEIIVHSQANGSLFVLNYSNGSFMREQYFHQVGYPNVGNPDIGFDSIIGCGMAYGCVIVYNSDSADASPNFLYARAFNSTNLGAINTLNGGAVVSAFCLPKSGYVLFDDTYYFTVGKFGTNSKIYNLVVNSSLHTLSIDGVDTFSTLATQSSCGRGIYTVTSPIKGEILKEPGKELFYGVQTDLENFKLLAFDDALNFIDDFPEAVDGNGLIISNPFTGYITGHTSGSGFLDVCMAGYHAGDREIQFVCTGDGNDIPDLRNLWIDNVRFTYGMEISDFNLTYSPSLQTFYSMNTWMIESVASNDYNEVLTPYGVFELEDFFGGTGSNIDCFNTGLCDMELVYELRGAYSESAISISDVDDDDFPELFGITDGAFFIINDGNSNQAPFFNGYWGFDPCIDQPIKINESLQATFTVYDAEGDIVNVSFEVYADTIYSQNHSKEQLSGGLIISDFFSMNQTITNGYIVVEVTDSDHQTPFFVEGVNRITKQFSVSSSGVVFGGGCITEGYIDNLGLTDTDGDGVPDTDESVTSDSQKDSILNVIAPPSLIAPAFQGLFLLAIIGVLEIVVFQMLSKENFKDPKIFIFSMGSIAIGGYLFGIWLGVFDAWILMVLIVLATAFLGLKFTPLGKSFRGGE